MAASAISIVLDPSEVATDRTELDINSGAIRIANDGPDWGDAAIAAALADRKFGSVPVGYRIPNRIVTIPLIVRADDLTFNQAQTKLQQKVARFQDEGGWLKRVSSDGTTKLYADIVDATLTFPDPRFQDMEGNVVLTLECLPDFYGDEAAGIGSTASSGDNDSLVFTEADIPGDYPARSRYTFTDTGSQARQAVLIASQARTYDADNTAALAYEAEALTPLDAAAIVTKSGAHGGASNNGVAHATISPSWIGILSTQHDTYGHLTHWGNYRVFARVWSYLGETQARLEYAVGDSAARRINPTVTIPSDSGFYIADFGEVRLNKVSTGTQQWMGAFFARSDDSGVAFGIDKIWLAPTESLTICKARQGSSTSAASLPLSTDYRDSFIQSSGNLSGKTADRGGNWTTAGSTTDFTIETTLDRAQRTTTSDSDMRFGVIGSAHTATYAAVDFLTDNFTTGMWQGLVLRYVDTSNFIAAIRYYSGTENRIDIIQRVAGTTTILLEATLSAQPAGGFKRIVASVATSGRVEVLFDGTTYSAVCTAAATGGALASGKVGIIDYNPSGSAATRQWDNFVGSSVTTDSACRSGGSLSARFDGAWRETSTAGIYAPAHVEGSHPRAPASGLESRTCRTLILPSAGDFDTLPDTDPLAFSVRSYHRPAYLFAPEE